MVAPDVTTAALAKLKRLALVSQECDMGHLHCVFIVKQPDGNYVPVGHIVIELS